MPKKRLNTNQINKLLSGILKKGEEQIEILKKKGAEIVVTTGKFYPFKSYKGIYLPARKADAKMITDPDNFMVLLLEEYWQFYKITVNNIKNPIVQFLIRPLLEFTYSMVIWYGLKNESKKKEIAVKYWLCNVGLFSRQRIREISYDDLIEELSPDERAIYENVQKKTIKEKMKEFHRMLYNLFPRLHEDNLPKELEIFTKNAFEKEIKREGIEIFFQWFSLFVHPNLFLLKGLPEEQDTQSHIFRSATILMLCGSNVLDFVSKKILKRNKDREINEIKKEIRNLYSQLVKPSNL